MSLSKPRSSPRRTLRQLPHNINNGSGGGSTSDRTLGNLLMLSKILQ
jgi:hypothetical protein